MIKHEPKISMPKIIKNMTFCDLKINILGIWRFVNMYEFWWFKKCVGQIRWDKDIKFWWKVKKNKYYKKKLQENFNPKFSCFKSWKTRILRTWESIFFNFDNLWTCMNFEGLRDVEGRWSEIKVWNFGIRSRKI